MRVFRGLALPIMIYGVGNAKAIERNFDGIIL